jgi:hypothetical protein
MPQPARNRTPLPVRIAIWRRRVVVGSIGVFLAAWLAVAGLGRQAASNASAGTATTTSGTTTQAQSQSSGSQAQSSDPQSDSSRSQFPQDLSTATTSQS